MNADFIFKVCNYAALVGWLLLVFAPNWKWTRAVIETALIPLMLAVVYLVLMIAYFGNSEGNFSTLDGVFQLFRDRNVVLVGWIHYLAFDLFIGSWEVRDARRLGIFHLLVIPCLFLTLMLGPVGLLAYLSSAGRQRGVLMSQM
ncbi:MAG: ABA4-like family protein [Planctomycetota bacterium]